MHSDNDSSVYGMGKLLADKEDETEKYRLELRRLEAKHEELLAENKRLQAEVKHWYEARQYALEAGDILKEELERLRADVYR